MISKLQTRYIYMVVLALSLASCKKGPISGTHTSIQINATTLDIPGGYANLNDNYKGSYVTFQNASALGSPAMYLVSIVNAPSTGLAFFLRPEEFTLGTHSIERTNYEYAIYGSLDGYEFEFIPGSSNLTYTFTSLANDNVTMKFNGTLHHHTETNNLVAVQVSGTLTRMKIYQ